MLWNVTWRSRVSPGHWLQHTDTGNGMTGCRFPGSWTSLIQTVSINGKWHITSLGEFLQRSICSSQLHLEWRKAELATPGPSISQMLTKDGSGSLLMAGNTSQRLPNWWRIEHYFDYVEIRKLATTASDRQAVLGSSGLRTLGFTNVRLSDWKLFSISVTPHSDLTMWCSLAKLDIKKKWQGRILHVYLFVITKSTN